MHEHHRVSKSINKDNHIYSFKLLHGLITIQKFIHFMKKNFNVFIYIYFICHKLPIIALVYSEVVALPPRSPVTYFYYSNTLKVAASI